MSFNLVLSDAQSDGAAALGEPCMLECFGQWTMLNPDGNSIYIKIEEDQLLLDDVGTRQDSERQVTIGIIAKKDISGITPEKNTKIQILDPSPYSGRVYEIVRPMSDSFQTFRFTMVESKDTP